MKSLSLKSINDERQETDDKRLPFEAKSSFDVELTLDGNKVINVIKGVMEIKGFGLEESKEIENKLSKVGTTITIK